MEAARGRGSIDQAGWWCADNLMCEHVWWCSVWGWGVSSVVGFAFWGVLFVALMRLVHPKCARWLETWPSKVEDENSASWFAWHVQSTIHACTVVAMAFPAVRKLSSAGVMSQFSFPSAEHEDHLPETALVALGSHVFFCYIVVDTFVALYREAMTPDYFAHHCVFVFFCLLIQYDCFAPYLAAFLLMMEMSTIFLNGFSFTRNRLGYDHWVVKVFFLLFATTFILCRLVGTTYIACYFSHTVLFDRVPFTGIPRWHLNVICLALMAAVAIQLFWGCAIARKLIRVMAGSSHGKKARPAEEELASEGGAAGAEHVRLKSG